jgi:ABC-2 type transport system permease protein
VTSTQARELPSEYYPRSSGVRLNAWLQWAELSRNLSFTAPSLGLPLITYLIFGLPNVHGNPTAAARIFAGFAGFAVLGIVMFQFGVGIASDRTSSWERYVRTLPASASSQFAARILVALAFSLVSLVPVLVCAVAFSPLHLSLLAYARVLVALLVGAVPMGLLGIMIGYLLSERGALPVTNLIFLPLSYAGGLFGYTGSELPGFAATVSPWLPTRQWSDLIIDFGLSGRIPIHQCLALAAFGIIFGALAVLGYRRDESRQYA